MIGTAASALWSHWRRRPLQLATLVLGLALATALWSGVQAINAEARASYAEAADTLGTSQFAQLVPRAGTTLPMETFVRLRRAGWLVSPVLDGSLGGVQVIGFDPLTAPLGFAPQGEGTDPDLSTFFAPPYLAFAHPDTAEGLALEAQISETEDVAPGLLITDLAAAQEWLGQPAAASRLLIAPAQPRGLPPLEDLAPELELRAPQQGGDIGRLTDSFHLNLTAFGLLSFAVGLFIVQGAIGLAFEQRRPLFRTLRALGMPLRALLALIAAELLALALISGLLGMALGYTIAAALLPDVAATLRGLYGAEVDGTLSLRPSWWLAGLGIAIAGTALAGGAAVYKVARMPLLAPALPRAWARLSEQGLVWMALAALALVAAAALLAQMRGLLAGFGFLGALLIAGALALPVLLFGALRLGQALARGPLAQWFWADTRQQLPGLSLALMALLLALATNIGVGTMVASFRLTFVGYLDQRLSSELYVSTRDSAQGAEMVSFLEGRADAVLPIWSVDGRVAGRPAEIFGITDHTTYREAWPLLDAARDAWDQVAAGEAALINEQMSLRAGLGPGDPLDLPGGWRVEIAGVYSDYGNPIGQVIVGTEALAQRFPGVPVTRFGLRTSDPEGLRAQMISELGLRPDQITDQAALKAFSMQVFERTFTVSAALNVLTLAVAGFAMLTSLMTLAALRLPQLAPVWALGLTRRRLAALELLRALVLAALVGAAAVPLGLLLAWALLNVINVVAFGWRLPMFLFPWEWVRLGGLSVLAALLAAAWPALALMRTPPARLVQVFAHER